MINVTNETFLSDLFSSFYYRNRKRVEKIHHCTRANYEEGLLSSLVFASNTMWGDGQGLLNIYPHPRPQIGDIVVSGSFFKAIDIRIMFRRSTIQHGGHNDNPKFILKLRFFCQVLKLNVAQFRV